MRGYVLYKLNTYTLIGGEREREGGKGREGTKEGGRGRLTCIYCIHVPFNFFKITYTVYITI